MDYSAIIYNKNTLVYHCNIKKQQQISDVNRLFCATIQHFNFFLKMVQKAETHLQMLLLVFIKITALAREEI